MQLEFHGAAQTVTGSCYLLTTKDKRILIDCGMFQGGRKLERQNAEPFPFAPRSIDLVIVTHAHIDHTGLLPKLVRDGYSGPIIATRATVDLMHLMLLDSAYIQESDAEWKNRKGKRAGRKPIDPLYTTADAQAACELLEQVRYGQTIEPLPGIKCLFRDAGHILGSSFVELWATENGSTRKIIFSGDVGNTEQAIIRDPEYPESADVLLVESTYGDRSHKSRSDTMNELQNILADAYREGGSVIIPAFAVGRTQEILYHLRQLNQEGRLPDFRIYVDSPMAISATKIYREHSECFDDQTVQILMSGEGPFALPDIHFTRATEQSRAINFAPGPKVVISASGMCDAGRILHHLKHHLWKPSSHIVFVGFQAEGSLGRLIVDGREKVKIFGEEINVSAQVHTMGGLSAHGDQKILLDWVKGLTASKPQTFVVHGEERSSKAFAGKLKRELDLDVTVPTRHEKVTL